jgi:hypothetical protein
LPVASSPARRCARSTRSRFFARLSREYVVWVRAHADGDLEQALRQRGHAPVRKPGTPCMVLTRPPAARPIATTLLVRRVATAKEAEDGVRITAAAFELAPEAAVRAFGSIESFRSGGAMGFVAYENGAPVGASLLIPAARAFGFYWVGPSRRLAAAASAPRAPSRQRRRRSRAGRSSSSCKLPPRASPSTASSASRRARTTACTEWPSSHPGRRAQIVVSVRATAQLSILHTPGGPKREHRLQDLVSNPGATRAGQEDPASAAGLVASTRDACVDPGLTRQPQA